MFRKAIPYLYLVISAATGALITFSLLKFTKTYELGTSKTADSGQISTKAPCNFDIKRLTGYEFVGPIVTAEPRCESEQLEGLKEKVLDYINEEKKTGKLSSASVYLKSFSNEEWIAIESETRYYPGSLLKVGVLITYLRMAETYAGLLNTALVYHAQQGFVFPMEHYRSDTVREGHTYRVKDLLRYMITCSDNRATLFLENFMDTTVFKREFADLGISKMDFNDEYYTVNVKEYAMLMKALYNACYLNLSASDFAVSLLTKSTFRDGLVKELPDTVMVAHKFGEAGNDKVHELHESGIVFVSKSPYLLTVMTRGSDWNSQASVIGHISKMVYDRMATGHQ